MVVGFGVRTVYDIEAGRGRHFLMIKLLWLKFNQNSYFYYFFNGILSKQNKQTLDIFPIEKTLSYWNEPT